MQPRFAVITGATEGIGFAIAEKCLAEGFDIAICARGKEGLSRVKKAWAEKYPAAEVLTVPADFSRKEDVLHFAEAVAATKKPVDILVNNAGIFSPGELATEPEGQLESMMAVNLFGAYYLTRALVPAMKSLERGHIFNICSVASLRAYPSGGAYSVTKYALLGFSDNLREELKEYRIRVTAICPGATWSRSWSGSGVPAERIMEAGDIAGMLWASFSMSPSANVENIVIRPLGGDL
jgi:short-subunit dehydrogenase